MYVITPFKNVAYQLAQELNKIGFTRYDENGRPTNVGTENPNIMNVAATRAKEEFYIIGDKKLYFSLKSDVIDDIYDIIRTFNSGMGS